MSHTPVCGTAQCCPWGLCCQRSGMQERVRPTAVCTVTVCMHDQLLVDVPCMQRQRESEGVNAIGEFADDVMCP